MLLKCWMERRVSNDALAVGLNHDQARCSFQCSRYSRRSWLCVASISKERRETKTEEVLQRSIAVEIFHPGWLFLLHRARMFETENSRKQNTRGKRGGAIAKRIRYIVYQCTILYIFLLVIIMILLLHSNDNTIIYSTYMINNI